MFFILKLLTKVIKLIWQKGWGIINPNINPMRNAPVYVKYFATILLASFWSLAFGLYTAQFFFIGINILAHITVISVVFMTWATFKAFKHKYPS